MRRHASYAVPLQDQSTSPSVPNPIHVTLHTRRIAYVCHCMYMPLHTRAIAYTCHCSLPSPTRAIAPSLPFPLQLEPPFKRACRALSSSLHPAHAPPPLLSSSQGEAEMPRKCRPIYTPTRRACPSVAAGKRRILTGTRTQTLTD